jgi:hypothetical protein
MVSLVRLAVTKATLTLLNMSLLLFNDLITNGFAESLGPASLPASAPWQLPVSALPMPAASGQGVSSVSGLDRLCLLLIHPQHLPPLRRRPRFLRLILGSLPFLWWLSAYHSLRTLFGRHYPMLCAAGVSTQAVAVRCPS